MQLMKDRQHTYQSDELGLVLNSNGTCPKCTQKILLDNKEDGSRTLRNRGIYFQKGHMYCLCKTCKSQVMIPDTLIKGLLSFPVKIYGKKYQMKI